MGSGCRRSARTGRRGQPRHDYCVQALRLWLTLPHRSPRAGVSDSAENAMSQPLLDSSLVPQVFLLTSSRLLPKVPSWTTEATTSYSCLAGICRRCYGQDVRFTMRGVVSPCPCFCLSFLVPTPSKQCEQIMDPPAAPHGWPETHYDIPAAALAASSPFRGKGKKRLIMALASGMHQGEEKESHCGRSERPTQTDRRPSAPVFRLISCMPQPPSSSWDPPLQLAAPRIAHQ